ncbi:MULTISPECIES: 4-alpha-glucanotransferase [unclassified Actinomyces]|uniref:4-alpha-glucanotransferase n=1 Tax=unclassified Actinomyces TaxID=2609248 RepID=UPI001373A1ED|nr:MULTISPECIES: 4-alpha-glucanotransferase [unclassified Actinomyces]MBW3068248.1 4-alpha-glucanotransferase [Actinomyces sp. 594]NDR53931.1 4-alpha-glucanotransferase [Actinomyces sp. 565]QHO90593.1 4-alpha-glucanotransferase [Actinomyces sp. 432]
MTESTAASDLPDERLKQLAEAHGVSTEYWDFHGNLAAPSRTTLVAVLAALGVKADTAQEVEEALREVEIAPWRRTLPPTVVVRAGTQATVPVHMPEGAHVQMHIILEEGDTLQLLQADDWTAPREVDGATIGQASFVIPEDLPLGWHTIVAEIDGSDERGHYRATAALAVAPDHLDLPASLGGRGWGVMAQLYSIRSRDSWGVGDADDLTELVGFLGDEGADFLLINPMHAAEPVGPMTPSPYLPVTRRFVNPIYIRPENILEVSRLSGPRRSLVQWAHEEVADANLTADAIDRDAAWKAKREALEVIFAAGRSRSRQRDFERFRQAQGQGLERFALWCALMEKYGNFEDWPDNLKDASSAFVANEARTLADRIDFYAWLQWIVDEQLARAQAEAKAAGMSLGLMDDLAVGVHPRGADAWAEPEAFAAGVGVGAPPDMYNQLGQNWSQPPWDPVRLAETAYAPLRDMVGTVLRHAGALRIDHVIGLFRLWWIPDGLRADQGAYVRYDHEAMIGVLLLEAHRAGAVIIGEDLGTVEPWAREYLASRGVLGTSVLWFEKQEEDGWPLEPGAYRHLSLSTVNTHDLPPTAGYLADEHVALRERLGLLTEPVDQVRTEARIERERMLSRLREYDLLSEDPSERETVEALYRYVVRTPSALVGVALVDGVGERRAQNQPGTDQEYPNWKMPLADGSGEVVLVEDLPSNVRLASLLTAVREEFRR